MGFFYGTPGTIRTCDLWLRKPTLYPAELRVLVNETKPRGFFSSRRAKNVIFARAALFPSELVHPG